MFSRFSTIQAALILALAGCFPVFAYGADLKQNMKIAPGLPASSNPSGAEAVGKLMNPYGADPSVPLPAPNLVTTSEVDQAPQKPEIYGRGQQGGQNGSILEGLIGVRIPFPAGPSVATGNSTSSVAD
jgi:hypothetical protein